ncbi:unnamed protein product [Psylliodes chrysocephalus]|uniref:Uncharacterized protein n=1 Tax=Psylliodes chrysocephalus TaxID=3402493 RepID=A0A9P0D3T1_9CUCU|nr:unnamed protein product [Psylliodes chrysocephala]
MVILGIFVVPKSYPQKYRKEWEKLKDLEGWLENSSRDNTKANCKYCKVLLNAKLADLYKHSKTTKHIQSAKPFSTKRQQVLPFVPISVVTNRQRKEAQLCLYAAVHTSINSVDHLSDLHKESSEGISVHRTKCTQIIKNIIGKHFQQILTQDIGTSPYSIIIDESTDISVLKILGIVIRYQSDDLKKTVSTFLGLVNIENGTAACIVSAIKTLLQQDYGLDLKKLQGIGTDNASTMVGINNGVFAKLKEEVPHLILVRCVCHSLQLALSKATEHTLPRNTEFIIKETYNWFASSSIRQLAYQNVYKTLNDGNMPLQFLKMCETRWISIEPAVKRIKDQWETLRDHFNIVRLSDNCYTAELLHSMYNDPNNLVYLTFIYPILSIVQKTNKQFESATADPTKLLSDLKNFYASIVTMIVNPTAKIDIYDLNVNIDNYLDPNPYLGFVFENACHINGIGIEDKAVLKDRCTAFLIKLAKEMRNRLPDNLKTLEKMNFLSVFNVLKSNKLPITELALKFTNNDFNINNIEMQWANIHTIEWQEKNNTEKFWIEVSMYRDASGENPFLDLVTLAFKILCLPHSNADVERVFSQMNIVKDKLRNRMKLDLLNNILHIRFGLRRIGKCCKDYNLPDVVLRHIGTMAAYSAEDDKENIADIENILL